MTAYRARFAPTPSGFLHFGNLLNFTLTWLHVRTHGGVLALRIDDLDAPRARPEYVQDIFDTLTWLGFDWDEGPRSPAEVQQTFSQTLKTEEYRAFLKKFSTYPCTCSRQDIRARTREHYDGFCRERRLGLVGDALQWRWRSPVPSTDVVLWRKGDLPAYHLVSLYEDLRFQTNLLVRGEDLLESSLVQRALATSLGAEGATFTSAKFIHHALLTDANGEKLSKSQGAHALVEWRRPGRTPEEVFLELSRLTGKAPFVSLAEAKKRPQDWGL